MTGRPPKYKLFENQKHSLQELENLIGTSQGYLYKYYRGERKIKNMPIKIVVDLAYQEKIDVNKLYKSMLEFEERRNLKK